MWSFLTLSCSCFCCVAALRPNIITIFADDLGFYDTAVYNALSPSPRLAALAKEGLLLDRHYVFRYCSPTRRSFLTGRLPASIATAQPDGAALCSDFTPLAATLLSEKLAAVGYMNHFVGKGHLGYQTTDHLPIARGFASHVGYLSGAESYAHGGGSVDASVGAHDMWLDAAPGFGIVPQIVYSSDYYAATAVRLVTEFRAAHAADDESRKLWVHVALQSVHEPYSDPPHSRDYPEMWDRTYANMLASMDAAVGNVTDAARGGAFWDATLVLFTSDNGGVGALGNNYPLRGHKHDPWEGGTRVVAFLAGGFLPAHVRGARSGDKLVHVCDWYATFCALAGAPAADDAVFKGVSRPIDGVDVWPLLVAGNATQPRALTVLTEVSALEVLGDKFWKLITLAGQSNTYARDATQTNGTGPCLATRQPDPPQPGRTDPIVNGMASEPHLACAVCNATRPCLFEVLADPSETANVADDHPEIVARLAAAIDATNAGAYVDGYLPVATLAANYTRLDLAAYRGFAGPCYAPKTQQ